MKRALSLRCDLDQVNLSMATKPMCFLFDPNACMISLWLTAVESVCIVVYFNETTYDSLLMTNLYWFRQMLGTKPVPNHRPNKQCQYFHRVKPSNVQRYNDTVNFADIDIIHIHDGYQLNAGSHGGCLRFLTKSHHIHLDDMYVMNTHLSQVHPIFL